MRSDMLKFFDLGVRKRGVVTGTYPQKPYVPCPGSLGAPRVQGDICDVTGECAAVCPTDAITIETDAVRIDLGRCIFCGECARRCPNGAMVMSTDFELASKTRNGLEVVYGRK